MFEDGAAVSDLGVPRFVPFSLPSVVLGLQPPLFSTLSGGSAILLDSLTSSGVHLFSPFFSLDYPVVFVHLSEILLSIEVGNC